MVNDVFKVFHADNPTFSDRLSDVASDAFPIGFTHVANVTALVEDIDFEACFQLTNHIDKPWWENDGVEMTDIVKVAGGTRSTSVGDVVMCPDGSAHMVKSAGWAKIR